MTDRRREPGAGAPWRADRPPRSWAALLLAGLLTVLGALAPLAPVGPVVTPAGAQETPTTTPAPSSSSTSSPGAPVPVEDEGCGDVLHDPGRGLGDPAAVVEAIGRVGTRGVRVRVRVARTMPGAGTVVALERRCGWRPDGDRDPRSLLLVVDPAAEAVGVWPGPDLVAPVAGRFAALRDRVAAEVDLGTADGVATLVDAVGALATADAPPDPLGCQQLVWDPEGALDGDESVTDAALALQADGHDLRVRVEPATDGDLDERLAQLEASCPGWQVDGDRPPRRVVVMVQPSSRSTGLWYGRDASDLLAARWEAIQTQTMNPRFRAGDVPGGLAAGLDDLTRSSPGPARSFTTDPSWWSSDGSGSDGGADAGPGPAGVLVLIGLVVVGAWGISYLSWKARFDAGETTESFSSYRSSRSGGSSSGWRSSAGRRSSGSGRRSSGGGGRRSSSGGGRRSGGGSTRW